MIKDNIKNKIKTSTEQLELGVTSVLDNFESGERTYYQGDEPVVDESTLEYKADISNIDIDSLTDEQILKLKARFEAL